MNPKLTKLKAFFSRGNILRIKIITFAVPDKIILDCGM